MRFCRWCSNMHGRDGKGFPSRLPCQGSLGHEGRELTPSSMERDLNSDLFPACSDQQGTRPMVSTGTVPLPHLGLAAHGSEFCTAAAITSQFSPGPASWHLTSRVHGVLVWSLPAHPVLPLDIRSSSLVVTLVYKAGSPKETGVVLSFWGLLLGTADILQFLLHECS